MKKKRIGAAIMAGLMAFSMTACGSTSNSSSKDSESSDLSSSEEADLSDIIPDKTVTLDVYDQLANYNGEQIGWFAKVMLDKFNVKLNIIPDSDGTYDTRMESGNLGDIVIWGDTGDQYQQAVSKGMLYSWDDDDLTDYAPDIVTDMKYACDKNREISGGKLYGIGYDIGEEPTDRASIMYDWGLRYDLYKEIGSPEIKNLDDLEAALKAMQQACPKDDNGNPTYGMSLFKDWDSNMVMYVKALASAYYGYDEFGFGLYDSDTQTYHDTLEENGPYLTALKFYNKLYQDGLLDPDSQTQGYDGATADYQNGTAFFNIFDFLGSDLYNTDEHLADGKGMFSVKPAKATPIDYGINIYGSNRVWSVGANTEYPELCLAIINWLCTPEGFLTSTYGPQGTCWDYDENGDTYLTEIGRKCITDGNTELSGDYSGKFSDGSFKMNNTTWAVDAKNKNSASAETYNWKNWKSTIANEDATAIEKEWREWAGANNSDEYLWKNGYKFSIGTMYSATEKSDELQAEASQVAKCICDNSWSAIYAKSDAEFESTVSSMIKQANEYGYQDLVEYQKNEAELRAKAENDVYDLIGATPSTILDMVNEAAGTTSSDASNTDSSDTTSDTTNETSTDSSDSSTEGTSTDSEGN